MSADELKRWSLPRSEKSDESEEEESHKDHFPEQLEKNRWQTEIKVEIETTTSQLKQQERDFIEKVKEEYRGEGFVTVDLLENDIIAVANSWSSLDELLEKKEYNPEQALTLRCYE